MNIFVTGTGTDIGKTIVSSWLCLKLGYDYFKPIQTGTDIGMTDSEVVRQLSSTHPHKEIFSFKAPLSPHAAAALENKKIDINKIKLPSKHIIIEGAGGLLVPINKDILMIDLIKKLQIPVILVTYTGLGTINHTLLSIEALRNRGIKILGVIMNGEKNDSNAEAIEFYGKVDILATIPYLKEITKETLMKIEMSEKFLKMLK